MKRMVVRRNGRTWQRKARPEGGEVWTALDPTGRALLVGGHVPVVVVSDGPRKPWRVLAGASGLVSITLDADITGRRRRLEDALAWAETVLSAGRL